MSNFGYAGEWIDETTGYSYNKARWYDISTGTFLSEDPLVQLTLNAFNYTEGNPLTQIDPLGLFSFAEAYNGILDNSTKISAILTVVGIGASFIPGGAVLGLPLAGVGAILSGASAERNFRRGNIADGIIDTIGVIPGAAIIKSSRNIKVLSKTIKERKNVEYKIRGHRQKQNRENGKIDNSNLEVNNKIAKNNKVIKDMNNFGIAHTSFGVSKDIYKYYSRNGSDSCEKDK